MAKRCPGCRSGERVKNGRVRGLQRWKCKSCGCNYTKSAKRGYPPSVKRRALELYLEGVGFRGIGRLLKVSNVTVLYWIRDLGEKVEALRPKASEKPFCHMMELDEMWHYVGKKKKNFGSGSLMIGSRDVSLPSKSEIVIIGPAKNSGTK